MWIFITAWVIAGLALIQGVAMFVGSFLNKAEFDAMYREANTVAATPAGIVGASTTPSMMLHEWVHMRLFAPHFLPFVPFLTFSVAMLMGVNVWIALVLLVVSRLVYSLLHEIIADTCAYLKYGKQYVRDLEDMYWDVGLGVIAHLTLPKWLLINIAYIHRLPLLLKVYRKHVAAASTSSF